MEHINQKTHWTFEKKINLGHIITTLTIAASVFLWALSVEKRVSVTEIKYEDLKSNIAVQNANIDKRLDKIDAKLDKLIYKEINK